MADLGVDAHNPTLDEFFHRCLQVEITEGVG
jgi:hypothetical protein